MRTRRIREMHEALGGVNMIHKSVSLDFGKNAAAYEQPRL